MRLFFNNILKFTAFFTFCCAIIIFISDFDNSDKESSKDHNILRIRNSVNFDNLDILFVGNSHSYAGIKPSIFYTEGFETYNYGMSTAGVGFYEILINDYLDNINQPPKMICLLVSPLIFSNLSDNFRGQPIHRYINKPLSHLKIVRNYNIEGQIFSLYQKSFKKAIKNILFKKPIINLRDSTNYRGFNYNEKIIDENEGVGYFESLKRDSFNYNKAKKFRELIYKIQEKGINVTFLELPTYNLEICFNNDYLSSYNEFISVISDQNQLIKVNKNLFKKSNFRDLDHLNNSGAEIASKEIISNLKSLQTPKP